MGRADGVDAGEVRRKLQFGGEGEGQRQGVDVVMEAYLEAIAQEEEEQAATEREQQRIRGVQEAVVWHRAEAVRFESCVSGLLEFGYEVEEWEGDRALVEWEMVRQLCMELLGGGVEVCGEGESVRGLKRSAVQAIGQWWGWLMGVDGRRYVKGMGEGVVGEQVQLQQQQPKYKMQQQQQQQQHRMQQLEQHTMALQRGKSSSVIASESSCSNILLDTTPERVACWGQYVGQPFD